MRFNAALARRVALILGMSFPAFNAALADGRAVLPPRWMVEAYLSDAVVKPSRDDIARAIIPGLGMVPAFLGGGKSVPLPTEYTTSGSHTVPSSFWLDATSVTAECIGGGTGGSTYSGGSGGAYAKKNSYSLSGLSALYLVVPNSSTSTAQSAYVRANNSSGSVIAMAEGSPSPDTPGRAANSTGDVRYSGGVSHFLYNYGGGAAGPSGNGGDASSDAPGSGGGSPAGAGGTFDNNGNPYGGGGGKTSEGLTAGGPGWIRLTFA